jgi:membrane-associated phospholipid phosphatase
MRSGGRDHRQQEHHGVDGVPAFAARTGGIAERFAARLGRRHPAAVFFGALLIGFILLAGSAILLGLFITDVLTHVAGIGSTDESFIKSLARDRTATLNDASAVGSAVGGAPVLPILAGLVAIVCAFKRRWLIAGFAVFVLAVESATYRVSSIVVPRERPHVHRLENLPADASFPSGHTAAAIAVYAGLVLLVTSRIRDGRVRVAAWIVAVLLPIVVAMSRMYRGMHHPLDVAGGVVIGIGAIAVLLFACRAAGCVEHAPAWRRSARRSKTARLA